MNLDKVIKDLEYMRKRGFIDCNIQCFLNQLKKVDSDKVTVPKFIANWIKKAKYEYYSILGAINNAPTGEVEDWLTQDNIEVFAKAWVNGYKVDEETKYTVKVKGLDDVEGYLNRNSYKDNWSFASNTRIRGFQVEYTRKELEEAGFGWVFSCEGMEVVEVEKG